MVLTTQALTTITHLLRHCCTFAPGDLCERLVHLVLSVNCFASYCLLTPLMSPKCMSPKDKKCKLIELIDATNWVDLAGNPI